MKKGSTGSSWTSAPARTDSLKHRQDVSGLLARQRHIGQSVVRVRKLGHRSPNRKVKDKEERQQDSHCCQRKGWVAL